MFEREDDAVYQTARVVNVRHGVGGRARVMYAQIVDRLGNVLANVRWDAYRTAPPRTAREEKAVCARIAQHYLNGENATVDAGSLARLLFEQRDAARSAPGDTEPHGQLFDEIEDSDV
jgi:hypothetical protein